MKKVKIEGIVEDDSVEELKKLIVVESKFEVSDYLPPVEKSNALDELSALDAFTRSPVLKDFVTVIQTGYNWACETRTPRSVKQLARDFRVTPKVVIAVCSRLSSLNVTVSSQYVWLPETYEEAAERERLADEARRSKNVLYSGDPQIAKPEPDDQYTREVLDSIARSFDLESDYGSDLTYSEFLAYLELPDTFAMRKKLTAALSRNSPFWNKWPKKLRKIDGVQYYLFPIPKSGWKFHAIYFKHL